MNTKLQHLVPRSVWRDSENRVVRVFGVVDGVVYCIHTGSDVVDASVPQADFLEQFTCVDCGQVVDGPDGTQVHLHA